MTRDAANAVDAEVDGAFPGLRANFQATVVHLEPRPEASLAELDKLRTETVTLCRAVGLAQTGRAVDHRWVKSCAAMLAEDALGVCEFDFTAEDNPAALNAVIVAAKSLLKDHREKEVSQPGNPF